MKKNNTIKKQKKGWIVFMIILCGLFVNTAMGQKTISYSTTPVDANFATAGNWNHTSTFGLAATNTLGTDLITLAAPNSTISVGDVVSGNGVPLGATIIGIDGAQTGVTISAVTTAAVTSVSFTFATPIASAIATAANNIDVTSLTADITYNVESGNTYFQRRLSNLSTSAADMTLSGAGTLVFDVNENQFYTDGGFAITHQSTSGTKFTVDCNVRINNTFATGVNRNNVLRSVGNASNILEFGPNSVIDNIGFGVLVSYAQSGTILMNGSIKAATTSFTCGIGNTTFGPTSSNPDFNLAPNWMNIAVGANVVVNTAANGTWYKNSLSLLRFANYAANGSSTLTFNTANVWNSPIQAWTNSIDRLTGPNLIFNADQTSNAGVITLGSGALPGTLNLTVASGVNVNFGNSSAITWIGGSVLNIYGFDTAGVIKFGSDATGLSNAQLAVIVLKDGVHAGKAVKLDATGRLIADTVINTWLGTTSAVWNNAANWSAGTIPNSNSNVVIPAVTSPALPPVASSSATMYSLTVNSGATLTINSSFVLTVQGLISNSGTVNLFNNAPLFQRFPVTNTGTGVFNVSRSSNSLKRLDFTMWSSPVTGTQTLAAFSPLTSQSPNRFYTYDSVANQYAEVPVTNTFATGTGYLIRMPNTNAAAGYDAGSTAITFTGKFIGTPNNGTYSLTGLTPDRFYAIGNPYPSPIGASAFIDNNATGGVLYFWRKTNAVANSTGSSYATLTRVGGTSTFAAASNTAPNANIPTNNIQVGQGFIVKTGLTATSLTFTNGMRNNSVVNQWFFKTRQEAEPDRVWLNLTSPTGVFSQTLVGYTADATLGFDNGFDGEYINDSPIALTSNIDNKEYTIQARPTFDATDVVALNFKTDVAGEYSIALDHFDGLFTAGQDVYLVDSKKGVETDLKTSSYTFTATAGVDNSRFSLKYQKTLSIDAPAIEDNSITVYANNGSLYVNSKSTAINNVTVYDIQGRLIAQKGNVKSTTTVINNLRASNQVLIVKIEGEDNNVITKKVLN
jgi:hypothetical protein